MQNLGKKTKKFEISNTESHGERVREKQSQTQKSKAENDRGHGKTLMTKNSWRFDTNLIVSIQMKTRHL